MFTQNYLSLIDTDKLINELIADLGDMILIKDYQFRYIILILILHFDSNTFNFDC